MLPPKVVTFLPLGPEEGREPQAEISTADSPKNITYCFNMKNPK